MFARKIEQSDSNLIAAIDIGSHKIACAIFQANLKESELKHLSACHQKAQGMKHGVITHMELLENAVLNAIHTAEQASHTQIKEVYVNVPGNMINSKIINLNTKLEPYPIDDETIKKILNFDQKAYLEPDEVIVHAIPIRYQLDAIKRIQDPRKMIGQNLQVDIHLITAPKAIIDNLKRLFARCDLHVKNFIVSPYASGIAVLTDDEIELGTTVIDIGSDITTIACFFEGNMMYLNHIPMGGASITRDIARGLNISSEQAEKLKMQYGFIPTSRLESHPQDEKRLLQHIIRSRMEEIGDMALRILKKNKIDPLWWEKLVVTGGGCQITGLTNFFHTYVGKKCRIGYSKNCQGKVANPLFSVCMGLIKYGYHDYLDTYQRKRLFDKLGVWQKIKKWFNEDL